MIRNLLHESWGRAIVGVLSAVMLAVLYFVGGVIASWYSSIVFADEMEPIAAAIKELTDQSKAQQDEWRCSEFEEELADFYAKQESGATLSARELDRMATIKARMGAEHLNCVRFED